MKKIPFGAIFFVIFILLVILIDLPNNQRIAFSFGPIKVDRTIHTPQINVNLFGRQFQKTFETKLGLDLRGGSHLLFEADTSDIAQSDIEGALESARNVIERRVNFYGVSEPQVQTVRSKDAYRISVDLPGVESVDEAIKLIGQTAQLEFKETGTASAELQQIATQSPQLAAMLAMNTPTGLKGTHVKKATVQFGQGSGDNLGAPSVQLEFNSEGAQLFQEITRRNIGKQVGIFLDDQILSAPTVQQEIIGGTAIITGQFTIDEAKNLALSINSGALPLPVKLIEQRTIGPTLGQEAIDKSLFAGVVGLVSVVLFMILYYGKFGIIATIGLVLYGLISYAIFRLIPVVLTLPGIAGFILSIGMAVDANILIFERIKEELRKGKSFDVAMRLGFGKALDAIKDANIATLLVAFILFNPLNWSFFPQFGLIKGFALTLTIGVLTSFIYGYIYYTPINGIFS
ncbi:MAG: Protein translocase subunit SecD [Microgenomates bacterium OLB23]|nr:MAG: Protein translocase subunit SecD [Microgenomates bacterium OLB23]